jgi:hypothetical protein
MLLGNTLEWESHMADQSGKHRVIGIRHALKAFKKSGLVENDVLYPKDAVSDVQSEILSVAQHWYKIGAKRGAIRILEAFQDGILEVAEDKAGKTEIVSRTKSPLSWSRSLNVNVGNSKQTVPKETYKLTLKDLEFDM